MGATERIIERLVPEWVEHQKHKAKDYNSEFADGFSDGAPVGFENADVLGIPGQFAEIWRKIWKLKRGMWDGAELVNESVREILLDLIGHCFLAIDMLDRKQPPAVPKPVLSATQAAKVIDYNGLTDKAHKALAGDPSDLEESGHILADDGHLKRCLSACSEGNHGFAAGCRYRIRRRRDAQ